MMVSEKLEQALAPLGIPVDRNSFLQPPAVYGIYLFDTTIPEVEANNRPVLDRTIGTLHLYAHRDQGLDLRALSKRAASLLRAGGFGAELGAEYYEAATQMGHAVIDFTILTASEGKDLPDE